jgi:hypothetical protein
MSCRETEDALVDLADGRLDVAAQVRLHDHVEGCAACRARAATWGRLVPALRAASPPPPDSMQVRRMELEIERQLRQDARAAPPVRSGGGGRLRPIWAMAALGVAAAAAWVAMRSSGGPSGPARGSLSATVARVSGASFAFGSPVGKGAVVGSGQALAVASGGEILLQIAPGTTVDLHGPARLMLAGTGARVELRLAEGLLDAVVAHRRDGETFAVVTDDARVEVRGTRFTVAALPGRPWVRVDEGRVIVRTSDGRERPVGTGESLALRAPAPPHAPPPPEPSPPTEITPPAAAPAASACETPAPACASTARRARLAMRARAYDRALAILADDARPFSGGGAACAETWSSCRNELRYLRAEALRLDGRLDAAIAAYKTLDHRGAPPVTRQNVLYAAAELEQRLGRAAAARADYERAFAVAPAGALSEESLLGAMETAWRQRDADAARTLAGRYLARFPRGTGAELARRIRSTAGAPSKALGPRP